MEADFIRQAVIFILWTFITFAVGYTMADNHAKGGKFKDWLNGFFE